MNRQLLLFLTLVQFTLNSQESDSTTVSAPLLDSMFIAETENAKGKSKVLHAEPLFIDLIRDLGARKGEREWNVGMGMTDRRTFDSYSALVEYEFAPVDRLGLEFELPFSFFLPVDSATRKSDIPQNKLNSVKLALQYTFYVNEKRRISLAVGYIHEFENVPFLEYKAGRILQGNIMNPFAIAAKRWGTNWHTLLYAGPQFIKEFHAHGELLWQVNSNIHYLIPGTRNFVGVELNKDIIETDFDMTIRPQMRVGIADNLLVGIVTGIPVERETQRLSMFIRLIYEPHQRHRTQLPGRQ